MALHECSHCGRSRPVEELMYSAWTGRRYCADETARCDYAAAQLTQDAPAAGGLVEPCACGAFPLDIDADRCRGCPDVARAQAPDPEYADVDEAGQLALGVPGEQRSLVGLAPEREEV